MGRGGAASHAAAGTRPFSALKTAERSRVPSVMGALEKSLAANRTEQVFSATRNLSPELLLSHFEGEPALPEEPSRAGYRFKHSPW